MFVHALTDCLLKESLTVPQMRLSIFSCLLRTQAVLGTSQGLHHIDVLSVEKTLCERLRMERDSLSDEFLGNQLSDVTLGYREWTRGSTAWWAFSLLVRQCGSSVCHHLPTILEVLVACSGLQKDPEMRQAALTLVEDIMVKFGFEVDFSCSSQDINVAITTHVQLSPTFALLYKANESLISRVVLPNLLWKAGKAN